MALFFVSNAIIKFQILADIEWISRPAVWEQIESTLRLPDKKYFVITQNQRAQELYQCID